MDYHLENLNDLVFIADGARWIWKWADKTYPESVQIVDFYHAKEQSNLSLIGSLSILIFNGQQR